MIRIWEQIERAEKDKPLPPIIPVVLSHSERGWHVPTSFEDTLELGAIREHVLPHVPRFRYIVDDLTTATDAQLATRISSLYVRVVMPLFRDGRRLPISLVFSHTQTSCVPLTAPPPSRRSNSSYATLYSSLATMTARACSPCSGQSQPNRTNPWQPSQLHS